MAEIKIDSKLFQKRISHFAIAWENDLRSEDGVFRGAKSLLVMAGKMDKALESHKNNAMHTEQLPALAARIRVPTTLMLFLVDSLYIVTVQRKGTTTKLCRLRMSFIVIAKHLDRLKCGRFQIKVLVRGEDTAENEKPFIIISDRIEASGVGYAASLRDSKRLVDFPCRINRNHCQGRAKGSFVDSLNKIFSEQCKDVEACDISTALSTYVFSVKDYNELRAIRAASKACVALADPYLLDEISHILDAKEKVTHTALRGPRRESSGRQSNLTFKSLDGDRYSETVTQISNLKGNKGGRIYVLEQEKLIEVQSKSRIS
ncbi:FACT complex subunit SPT16 [Tolypocladium ophioglossoides CBS 100239]|uniref:FACT complex subunit n=1 Tax=Tolypocladium ophioglossoides (strain CBS 100239) TaxID=1163406 RepID=A0A0L0NCR7_TOLOC|nr:FACT complex subunit SPT16 [Tolypocladium ophioglossoides CBS 100239]